MQNIPFFKKADMDASIGVFFDGFSKVIVAIAILSGAIGLQAGSIYGIMMPGMVIGVILLHGALCLYYRQVAKRNNDPNLTAVPAGLQAGRIFIWLFSIMLPVYGATNNAETAFYVGVFAHFLGSLVFILGAFTVPRIVKIIPPAALFGALASGAFAFLILQSMDGVLKMPIVGWVSLMVLLVIYFAKLNVKVPPSFIGIVSGAVVAWVIGSMKFDAVGASLSNVGFYLPKLTFGIFKPEIMEATLPFLPIIIIFSIGEVISGIQSVEQARKMDGEHFEVTKPIVIAGIASLISSLFGNPFALGLYWGYPGWKKINAGTGYHIGSAAIYVLVGLTGLTAIINAFIPEATVLPILVFIGIASFAQAFEVVDKKYYPAAIIAFMPLIMEYIRGQVAPDRFIGFEEFRYGSVFIGMILGSMFVFVIDKKWAKAAIPMLCAVPLLLLGMIHSPGVVFTNTYKFNATFLGIYVATAAVFFAMHVLKVGGKNESDS